MDNLLAKINDFGYFTADIGEITPNWEEKERSDGVVSRCIESINYQGDEYEVGNRFIISLCSKFGIGTSIFCLFDPAEVFERIQMVHPRQRIRVVTEESQVTGKLNCLAVTSPRRSYVDYETLMDILSKPKRMQKIKRAYYADGSVTTIHIMDDAPWEISGDLFYQAFTLDTPIDGYGLPSIYLSLIRASNSTLLTAENKTFKSEIQLGKDKDAPEIPLTRVLDTFNNEEGFQAIRQRLESAKQSYASLNECEGLYKRMDRVLVRSQSQETVVGLFESLRNVTGDVTQKYGIATDDSVSSKKARLLPMDCTVLDLVFFSMELTTNFRSLIRDPKQITRWVGETIGNEYDLEGSILEEEEEEA